jgi:hypothetical protein
MGDHVSPKGVKDNAFLNGLITLEMVHRAARDVVVRINAPLQADVVYID